MLHPSGRSINKCLRVLGDQELKFSALEPFKVIKPSVRPRLVKRSKSKVIAESLNITSSRMSKPFEPPPTCAITPRLVDLTVY